MKAPSLRSPDIWLTSANQGDAMNDTILFALLIAGAGFVITYVLGAVLNFFVALKSRPVRRAAWTIGIAYVVLSIATEWAILVAKSDPGAPTGSFPVDPLIVPLLIVPGALAVFMLRLWGYRATWVEDESELREGEKLANDDWRIGLGVLALVIAVLLARALWKYFLRFGS
jgi:hypothetical protein